MQQKLDEDLRGQDQPRTGGPGAEADGAEAERKSLHATELEWDENRRRREELVERLGGIPPEKMISLDESGVTTLCGATLRSNTDPSDKTCLPFP